MPSRPPQPTRTCPRHPHPPQTPARLPRQALPARMPKCSRLSNSGRNQALAQRILLPLSHTRRRRHRPLIMRHRPLTSPTYGPEAQHSLSRINGGHSRTTGQTTTRGKEEKAAFLTNPFAQAVVDLMDGRAAPIWPSMKTRCSVTSLSRNRQSMNVIRTGHASTQKLWRRGWTPWPSISIAAITARATVRQLTSWPNCRGGLLAHPTTERRFLSPIQDRARRRGLHQWAKRTAPVLTPPRCFSDSRSS
mmetsp:Transcript_47525/g.77158  ORF Transcript_47525/g.77158 Transcript_47525/m.77158 type:complete len:248 (-) Transcript_47525:984-1727(-)